MQLAFNFDADPEQQELEQAVAAPIEHYRLYQQYDHIRYYNVLTAEHLIDISIGDYGSTEYMRYTRSRMSQRVLYKAFQKVI